MTETGIELTIGVATHGQIEMMTTFSMLAAKQHCVVDFMQGCYIINNRNSIAGRLKTPYLLFCDSDIVFKPEHVMTLLDAIKKEPERGAISGVAMYWNGSALPIHEWKGLSPRETQIRTSELMEQEVIDEPDKIGTGFLMIDGNVFKEMEYPWFQTPYVPGYEQGFDTDAPCMVGEDVFFIQNMRRAGYKPGVHFGVPVGHMHKSYWDARMLSNVHITLKELEEENAVQYRDSQPSG